VTVRTALTIAGTDSGGGAGVIADVRTFGAFGVWPLCAVTAVTAQDATRVHRVTALGAEDVTAQIEAVALGIGVNAAKTGLLPDGAVARAVAAQWHEGALVSVPLVVDPVLVASSGDELTSGNVARVIREQLVPRATVITPNLAEAGVLLGAPPPVTRDDMEEAAAALLALGCGAVLLTGGHLDDDAVAADVLLVAGHRPEWLDGPRIPSPTAVHGTGCVLSAAVTAALAGGGDITAAAREGKRYVTGAIQQAVTLGGGTAVRPW
jgi:hydroxymethylpyrimidine/phosphomethylpyrimidine kinase